MAIQRSHVPDARSPDGETVVYERDSVLKTVWTAAWGSVLIGLFLVLSDGLPWRPTLAVLFVCLTVLLLFVRSREPVRVVVDLRTRRVRLEMRPWLESSARVFPAGHFTEVLSYTAHDSESGGRGCGNMVVLLTPSPSPRHLLVGAFDQGPTESGSWRRGAVQEHPKATALRMRLVRAGFSDGGFQVNLDLKAPACSSRD